MNPTDEEPSKETEDNLSRASDQDDGVVNLSPFKSRLAAKERAHRLVTNIFELELDQMRHEMMV